MEKQAFEPTGLIPRSIIRTVDRFVQQLLPGREKIALQEYRVSRYQILVSIKSLLTLFLIPILVSSTMKALLFTPLVEHFWNKNQSEIFLNQYQEKRAFSEMHDFSEKMFFESLLIDNKNKSKPFESENFDLKSITNLKSDVLNTKSRADTYKTNRICLQCGGYKAPLWFASQTLAERGKPSTMVYEVNSRVPCFTSLCESLRSKPKPKALYAVLYKAEGFVVPHSVRQSGAVRCIPEGDANRRGCKPKGMQTEGAVSPKAISRTSEANRRGCIAEGDISHERGKPKVLYRYAISRSARQTEGAVSLCDISHSEASVARHARQAEGAVSLCDISRAIPRCKRGKRSEACEASVAKVCFANQHVRDEREKLPKEIVKFVTDVENEKYQILFQKKSLELAKSYNKQSILAITNLLGDFFTFFTLFVLFRIMRPELIILKSFLTESVYSLSDTTKSFLLILGMDLLVGFHSPRGWELLLEGFLRHIGLPENENFILLFVALFPVFLDTVFKYWIFRYLNKISPSTVVTYHSMIE